jgi:hypothetical protein
MRHRENSEAKFQRLWRSIAGSFGVVMLASSLLSVLARMIDSPFSLGAFFVLILSGVMLEFFAIAPEKVRISIGAFVGLPARDTERDS